MDGDVREEIRSHYQGSAGRKCLFRHWISKCVYCHHSFNIKMFAGCRQHPGCHVTSCQQQDWSFSRTWGAYMWSTCSAVQCLYKKAYVRRVSDAENLSACLVSDREIFCLLNLSDKTDVNMSVTQTFIQMFV